MSLHTKLVGERNDVHTVNLFNVVEPTRAQEAIFERLAAKHGGIRIELFTRDGEPWAYVRNRLGDHRYDVPPYGPESRRLNADMAPYDESEE